MDEKRISDLEESLRPEERGRDLLLTIHEEQWERAGDGMMVPAKHRRIIAYTEVVWQSPNKNGTRIGTRRAIYEGGQVSSFDPEVTGDGCGH
jgi:hypothetical protein